jgi:hypothetical protein
MASTYLTRTFSTPTNRKIFTWSAWVKRQNQVTDYQNALFGAYLNSSVRSVFRFNAHRLNFQDTEGSVEIKTNRLFRDVNAWYHIVLSVDTTQATASNRVKMYVNGVQETSFYQGNYPAQNSIFLMGGADIHYINARNSNGSVDSIADMSYSHIHFTDGTAYDATPFGETDATTGEWKIKTDVSVTYGNNGFFILKDGNSVTDQSGNSNNWTVGAGTLTKTEDCPSNVFATLNPLSVHTSGSYTFTNGNTTSEQDISRGAISTLGMTSGKFYSEVKFISTNTSTTAFGIVGLNNTANQDPGYVATGYTYRQNGQKRNNNSNSSFGNTYATGDIIGIAVDLDNLKIYFSINGTWQNSGDPTSGSTGTGSAFTITAPSSTPDGAYFFAWSDISDTAKASWNFGNGYFGTTAVSSAGTNASNNGIFEYDVPTGYTALSTRGLNS